MRPDGVQVSLVVVTWNSSAVLPGLFASLPAALEGVERHELVVADNASSDGTASVVAAAVPHARFVQLGWNAGYSAGVNAAIGVAAPDSAILVLNPDVRLGPGSVRRLLAALEEPATGIAVPRLVDGSGRLAWSLRREPTVLRALGEAVLGGNRAGRFAPLGEVVVGRGRYDRAATADWASGAAMMVSRRCVAQAGPWDESFFLYAEETEYALRARDLGFVLRYVPEATAVHLGGDSHRSERLWTILTLNRVRLFRRRHGVVRASAFWAAITLNEMLRALRGRPTSRAALAALVRPSRRPEEAGPCGSWSLLPR